MMQRCWYITVRDRGIEGFLAEANYADTFSDQTLLLEIERKTLKIKSAVLEVHRGRPDAAAKVSVSSLEGITAYFGSGRQLRQALEGDAALLDMATQAVSAVIQAEAFFFEERGFASGDTYENFWDETAKDSCVYYSNLDRVTKRFIDSVQYQFMGTNLYHRYLLTSIDDSGEVLEIRGHLLDFFHEMTLSLKLDKDFKIQKALAATLRCPDDVCREAVGKAAALEGRYLTIADLRRYPAICGGGSGCTHITHLVQEAAQALDIHEKSKGKS